MSRPKNWDAHRRRELTRKSREARASNERLDARTDQWLKQCGQFATDLATEYDTTEITTTHVLTSGEADAITDSNDLHFALGTTTLEEAVEKLRRTLGKRQQR